MPYLEIQEATPHPHPNPVQLKHSREQLGFGAGRTAEAPVGGSLIAIGSSQPPFVLWRRKPGARKGPARFEAGHAWAERTLGRMGKKPAFPTEYLPFHHLTPRSSNFILKLHRP